MKIAIILLSISLFTGAFIYNFYQQKQPDLVTTTIYPDPKPLPEFELIDHNNHPFGKEQLLGKWSVLFFGFTSCPDVCPTTMSALAEVANKLSPELQQQVQFILVSVDPERDPPKRLAEYIPAFHPDFIALTGKNEQLLAFSLSLGAVYMKVPTGDSYMMSHSSTLFIVNPDGNRYGIFSKTASGNIDIAKTAQDLETLLRFH